MGGAHERSLLDRDSRGGGQCIESFFDNLDHALLLRAVQHFTDCRWVLLYVERWLRADVVLPDGHHERREKGTPQGGVVSPVLANLPHFAFDRWMRETCPDVPFARRGNDLAVPFACSGGAAGEWRHGEGRSVA
jgi:RNA-directed DNA polymerase